MAWTLCDDDTLQYAQEQARAQYRLIQMFPYNAEKDSYMVYTDVISLTDYLDQDGSADKELASILRSYEYADVQYVRNEYGDMADQVMCECIFESLILELTGTILFRGTAAECAVFINDYIK